MSIHAGHYAVPCRGRASLTHKEAIEAGAAEPEAKGVIEAGMEGDVKEELVGKVEDVGAGHGLSEPGNVMYAV